MSKKRQCRGCGSHLQSESSNQPGYLPAHLLTDNSRELICQRCYKIKHYGKITMYQAQPDADQVISNGMKWAEAVIIVLDLFDFAASIPKNASEIINNKPVVFVINKIDLLPPKTSVAEAKQWVSQRLEDLELHAPVYMVSGTTGAGVEELSQVITDSTAGKLMIIGVTNSGKSTLIGQILKAHNRPLASTPTTSTIPGTTAERLEWKLGHNKVLSDTPGFIPTGRLSDLVCQDCAMRLIPQQKLHVKVHELGKNSALVIPGYAAVKPLSQDRSVLVGFTASEVVWLRTNEAKINQRLNQVDCECFAPKWNTVTIEVPNHHDLMIHGLGWVSARKADLVCELTIPEGIGYTVWPNLIGGKKYFS